MTRDETRAKGARLRVASRTEHLRNTRLDAERSDEPRSIKALLEYATFVQRLVDRVVFVDG
ncbi:hypothetical protein LCGC14_0331780 [marine sediment metagenome]|uniref:Uncharacterized protein n=1 Tax=marine sediment metagenome TaxID=412755 RepID=A0A0F9WNI4_9ZZZZ